MQKKWWKESVVYQIYPRSFKDSNGDGIGDLRGIISKLDYLKDLGVDVIWLSPVYQSPNDDNGYDISDYREIMTEFGTMADFDKLLAEMHKKGLKLVMDLVVNHTSDEHPWFVASRADKTNPYRDFYIWRTGKADGREPNNWLSFFSGSAWELDPQTGEYYLHLFSKKQPDLNWENPEVRREVYEMMRWWLDKGVDGFRMDVINLISKVPGLPDAGDPGRYEWGGDYFINGPRVHEFLQEMGREVLSRYDIMTVGESMGLTPETALDFIADERGELNMVFDFNLIWLPFREGGKWRKSLWSLADLKECVNYWQAGLHGRGWNCPVLGNHDSPRVVSHLGDDGVYRVESAKLLATLLLTLEGTPFIYQGDEIGMTNVAFDAIDEYRDIETLNAYQEHVERGGDPAEFLRGIHKGSRDNARTPMQWDEAAEAGFTEGSPWIGVNPNYKEINVRKAEEDPDSVLHYYKRLLRLRKEKQVLIYGKYELFPGLREHERVFAYTRTWEGERVLVVLNFSPEPVRVGVLGEGLELWLGNYGESEIERDGEVELRPYEARVYGVKK